MFSKYIKHIVLKRFFHIELSSQEQSVAIESVQQKYATGLRWMAVYVLLALFPIMFLETSVLVSVLIPITMVAGTAWFAISLANMRQKFEAFGLELTKNLFEAFAVSLGLLFALSVASLSEVFWRDIVVHLPHQQFFRGFSLVCGAVIIGNIVYKIFIGSIKYDINDAMLTGQHEAAERFYRKSLSLLYSVAESLRSGKSLQVANYYIGVAFFEIFSYMKNSVLSTDEVLNDLLEQSNRLVKNPGMSQVEASTLTRQLILRFVSYCTNPQGSLSEKSLQAIHDELSCLQGNTEEDQAMQDTRFAIIFQEIASLLEGQGETLFYKNV